MDIATLQNTYTKIVIFDTEYTTWEGAMERGWSGANEHRELVQLAAVIIDVSKKQIVDECNITVRPRINTEVSTYFTELTQITQTQVDAGVDFSDAYTQFMAWSHALPLFSYAQVDNTIADGAILRENIELYKEDILFDETQFFNIRPIFIAAGVPTEKYNSGKLHQYFGVAVPGHEHDAMHDVYSLAVSLFELY